MTDTTEHRRTFLALAAGALGAGVAAAAIPEFAQAAPGGTSGSERNPKRKNPNMRKQTVEIGKENAVYGTSSRAFEKYGYSPAVKANGLLFIAGTVGVRPDGAVPDSVEEQSELAFRRLSEILRLEGLTMADLVEVVSYHVDIGNNLKDFIPAKERYFENPFPTWTIIGVEALARPALKVEIRSIAVLRT
ncbi:RidA family protein [Phyllobacterium myrsinacearum]|nr:RidA family protein [Phyllobacterium myrsinacearum]PWV90489.1 enamine deaminase RidA (YjgF/YER057c/UK114 family) [Phyllobacterium myrsinacearum]RZV05318.1 enamine deaminase RidA (YjgF/YER057c/UK114 family) [Phyllobacterium myrsinacearum]